MTSFAQSCNRLNQFDVAAVTLTSDMGNGCVGSIFIAHTQSANRKKKILAENVWSHSMYDVIKQTERVLASPYLQPSSWECLVARCHCCGISMNFYISWEEGNGQLISSLHIGTSSVTLVLLGGVFCSFPNHSHARSMRWLASHPRSRLVVCWPLLPSFFWTSIWLWRSDRFEWQFLLLLWSGLIVLFIWILAIPCLLAWRHLFVNKSFLT